MALELNSGWTVKRQTPQGKYFLAGNFCCSLRKILPVGLLYCFLAMVALVCSLQSSRAESVTNSVSSSGRSEILVVNGKVWVLPAGVTEWQPAKPGQYLDIGAKLRTGPLSQATVRFADFSVMRINELTTFELIPPQQKERKPLFDLKSGSLYFFSREKPADVQFRTPNVSGAIRGTEFHLRVSDEGNTALALLDGEVELKNSAGQAVLHGGELAEVVSDQAPKRSALVNAINTIQWCLYYPGILDLKELSLTEEEKARFGEALNAYQAGDLVHAVASMPARPASLSDGGVVFLAALHLCAGQVDLAEQGLQDVKAASPFADALREMVAAVQFKRSQHTNEPVLASELMARSYYCQSRADLDMALKAARAAATRSPELGFAWARIAELEFSLGNMASAKVALENALRFSPRNAHAIALKGFFEASANRTKEAIRWFDRAIELDGSLANAWLGRGLCFIREGELESGRQNLQTAAALEPHRSILRSYLAKAYMVTGQEHLAAKDLRLAKQLDPNDPTPWLYSALLNQRQNRINQSIQDLERSQALNDNRAVFRSRYLLDQDRAVRAASLASIYRDAGMHDVATHEAAKAVNEDYLNFSAHLFLSESLNFQRDQKYYSQRYAASERSEWLMASLLAPSSANTLSRGLSEQDYSRLFERDRLGLSSDTKYVSNGEWLQRGSQYGSFGNIAYSADAFYHSDRGLRPNNDLEQTYLSFQIKAQLTSQDSIWMQSEYARQESGDIRQYFSQRQYIPTLRVNETEEPNLWAGYHREWSPNMHTLFLAGRLESALERSAQEWGRPFVKFGRGPANGITSILPRNFNYKSEREFEAYTTELQQIWQTDRHAVIFGGRYQAGWGDTVSELTQLSPAPGWTFPSIRSASETSMDRAGIYGYYQWQIWEPLRITAGLAYDRVRYPPSVDTPIPGGEEESKDLLAPKVGLAYTPWKNTTIRGAYSRSLGGYLHENSYQLEPSQIAGFNQTFRSLIPESAEGVIPAAAFETRNVGVDQKFASGTYLTVEGEWLKSDGDQWIGAVTSTQPFLEPNRPYTLRETLDFQEKTALFTVSQLLSREWSIGARYRVSQADLTSRFPDIPASAPNFSEFKLNQNEEAILHQVNAFVVFNHSSGFFSQFQAIWSAQKNMGYTPPLSGDDFWQENFFVGYRFPRRVVEVSLGVLNLTDQDYQLNPLNLYSELPRQRTLVVDLKINF